MIELLRPHQWAKSAFIFAGIFFAEAFFDLELLWQVFLAAVAFSLVSSGVYVFNDLQDVERDKLHPRKKYRPLACGKVSTKQAWMLFTICVTGGLLLASYVGMKVLFLIGCYLLLNIAYSLRLKHVVLLDVFCIATGFMLRLLVGTVGVGIPPSKWLLLCGLMITLFLGFAKRRAELVVSGVNVQQRAVLQNYGSELLDNIIAICATGVIISYSLYTMSEETIQVHQTENLIATVPFVIYGLFRYIFLLHQCKTGENPSRDLFRDRHIVVTIAGWLLVTTFLFI